MWLLFACVVPTPVSATLCDAWFPFDGNLEDASGNAYHGELIDASGNLLKKNAEFVDGMVGKALEFQPDIGMRAPLDLNVENCPQLTITAWVYFPDDQKGMQSIVSTGFGGGPHLARSSHNIYGWAGGNEIREASALRPELWIFVAGVWDYKRGVHRVYWRMRSSEEAIGASTRRGLPDFFVGAYSRGASLTNFSRNMRIDDLRVYGRVLDDEEIQQVQAQNAPALRACACDDSGFKGVGKIEPRPIPDFPTTGVAAIGSAQPDYAICDTAGQCTLDGEQCYDISVPAQETNGSFCSRVCSSDSDCGAARGFTGACYALGGSTSICYQRCDQVSDCSIGSACVPVTLPGGTLDGVCVPDNR